MSSTKSKNIANRTAPLNARYAALKSELQGLGFVCVGSLQSRYLECGKVACRCHADASNRHGPYNYWTRKVAGKTVSVLIPAEDAAVYREWLANNRALDRIVRQMRKLSARALYLTTSRRAR